MIKRLFCKHEYKFSRNIYSDEIIYVGFKRSVWKCSKCGKVRYGSNLHTTVKDRMKQMGIIDDKTVSVTCPYCKFGGMLNPDMDEWVFPLYHEPDCPVTKACVKRKIDYTDLSNKKVRELIREWAST